MKKLTLTVLSLVIYIGAFAQLKVIQSGDVGIGEENPAADLHINNPSANVKLRLTRASSPTQFTELQDFGNGVASLRSYGATFGQIDIDPIPIDGAGFSGFRFFRSVNTTGSVAFSIFAGNGSGSANHFLSGNNFSYMQAFNGNLVVGTVASGLQKFHVHGNAYKSEGGDLWDIASDKSLKNNIKELDYGLDLLMKIRPIEYTYNGKAGTKKGENQIGVIAQELNEIAPFMTKMATWKDQEHNADSGEMKTIAEEEIMLVNASALKWITVKAIQEQQAELDQKEERIVALEKEMAELKALLMKSNSTSNGQVLLDGSTLPSIQQNRPNPFNGRTTIDYNVPTIDQSAQINILNVNGQLLKSYAIPSAGKGTLEVETLNHPSGTYMYQLVVDGAIHGSKKMIVQD